MLMDFLLYVCIYGQVIQKIGWRWYLHQGLCIIEGKVIGYPLDLTYLLECPFMFRIYQITFPSIVIYCDMLMRLGFMKKASVHLVFMICIWALSLMAKTAL